MQKFWTLSSVVAAATACAGSPSNSPATQIADSGAGGASSGEGGAGEGGAAQAGKGGLAGTGGGVHVVRACTDEGAAPAEVGVWEDITPEPIRGFDYAGGAVLVNPLEPAIVYLGGGDGGGLFKSTDCGSTWTHINTGRNGEDLDGGRMWDMKIDFENPDTLYMINGYGQLGLWKSTNGGVDWDDLMPEGTEVARIGEDRFASIVGMDPTDPRHLVVAFHNGCSGDYAPCCMAETLNGGEDWRMAKAPTCGEGVGVIVINSTTWITGDDGGVWQTSDNGENWEIVSNASTPHYQLYISEDGRYFIGTKSGVLMSNDGSEWTLIEDSGFDLTGIVGDGRNIYASQQFGGLYFSAPEQDPTNWTELDVETGDQGWGAYYMAYDKDHHILYGSEMGDGLWRVVTY